MTGDELDQLLEAGHETQSIEIKAAMAWDHLKLAKDILALANFRDGGYIIIGIDDQSFTRHGITPEIRATYQIETMRDQIARYADPYVEFHISFPRDSSGKEYVAIEVAPFRDTPVICRKDSTDTCAGVIYYRSSNRRIESAPVSNSYDMQDIIFAAVARTRMRLQDLGAQLVNSSNAVTTYLDQELNGL